MIFQNYALFPHLRVEDNIAFPLEMRGVSRKEALRAVADALDLVQLGGYARRYPRQLSGGQQQRVALARAIVFKPDLLLMDEPLGALDRRLRAAMQVELLQIVRETSVTVVSVTHDQEEALVMSDRIALYHASRIEQLGTSQELYEHPKSIFVANFMGDANVLRGVIEPGPGAQVVRGGTWHARVTGNSTRYDAGDRVAVIVRPEYLTIGLAAPEGPVLDGATGTLVEVDYLGAEWRYIVKLPDGSNVQARIRRDDLAAPLEPGSSVSVAWRPEHAVVLPEPEGPG